MRPRFLPVVVLFFSVATLAKDSPQVINWPESGEPVLRFTVQKVRHIGSFGGQQTSVIETQVESVWSKRIPSATFRFFMYDKNKVRIGEGSFDLTNLSPHETIRMELNAVTAGTPVTLSISPQSVPQELAALAPPKVVSMNVYSVPSGAKLSVDGKEAGATPVAVRLAVGGHTLQFSKEGFNSGSYPLMVTPDQVSGGQVTYELGSSAHDTVELRDGTLLNADVESVSPTEVVISMGGKQQTFERNQVKRILFVQRDSPISPR
jgi:hypothetical protein